MTIVGVSFAVALAAATVLAVIPKERSYTLACAAMLWAGWVVNVLVITPAQGPYDMLSPAMDAIFGWCVWRMAEALPAIWVRGILFAFLTQLVCHIEYHILRAYIGDTPEMRDKYELAVNILLGIAILCLGFPGVRRAGGALLHLLLRVPGLVRGREALQ